MVEARLEVLITARNQLRGTLRKLDEQISKIRTQIQSVNRQRTDRVTKQFDTLRARAKAVGLDLRGLSNQFLRLNRARLNGVINSMRRLRGASIGAAAAVRTLTVALAPFIGVFALVQGIIGAVRTFAEFEQQLQVVGAIAQATEGELKILEDTARELGATTRFTAQQAAEGLEFLVRAGFSAREATDALEGTLALASAGLIDLGTSASIVSSIVRQFGIDASEAGDVADVLAQTAASSNTNVRQLGEAFKFVGPIVASVGGTVKDTAFVLGVLGNAGIQATVAGAGLRRAIGGIVNPTKEAAKSINSLLTGRGGLNQLQSVLRGPEGLIKVFELLGDASLDVGDAFNIFQQRGGLIAIALTRLIKNSGELQKRFDDLNGAAIRISTQIEDTLLGDFRKLRSASQELILQVGRGGLGEAFRGTIQTLTSFVRGIIGAEGATGPFAEAGRNLANIFKLLATNVGISFKLIAFSLTPAFKLLGFALQGLGAIAEEIIETLRALGIVSTDVSKEVETSLDIIRQASKEALVSEEALEEGIETLKKFKDGQLNVLLGLEADLVKLRAQREAAGVFAFFTKVQLTEEIVALEAQRDKVKGVTTGTGNELIKLRLEQARRALLAATDAEIKEIALLALGSEKRIAILDARINLIRVRAKSESQILRDQLKELEDIDKLRAAQGLPRLENFFKDRAELTARATQIEVDAARNILRLTTEREQARVQDLETQLEDIAARIEAATDEELGKLRRTQAELTSDLRVAEINGVRAVAEANSAVNAALTKQSTEGAKLQLENVKNLDAVKKALDAAAAEIREPFDIEEFEVILQRIRDANKKNIALMEEDSEGAKILEKQFNVEAVQQLLSQTEAAVSASNAILAAGETELERQRDAGVIGEIERQTQVRDARRLAAEEQQRLLAPLLQLQADGVTLTDAQTLKIIELKNSIKDLADASLPLLQDIQEAFVQSFGRFLEDIISGSKSAKEAFRDFAKDVVAQIQKIIIQQVILNALRGAFGGGAPAAGGGVIPGAAKGGLMKLAKGGLQRFAAGGPPVFKGPGTDTSDSILANVSRGEYVMPAAITRQWLGVLEVMRSGKFSQFMAGRSLTVPRITSPSVGRFQQGGLVEPKQTVSTRGEQRGIRLINVVDPSLVRDFLTSSEGEEVFFNLISKNPETVRRLIA